MKKLSCAIIFTALIMTLAVSLNSRLTYAHSDEPREQEETHANPEEQTQDSQNYSYIADPGCSLSLLARRSLQLYDEQTDKVSLNKAQIIYAETHIVKEAGARWLLIGEQVEIDGALVSKYAHSSQELNAANQRAWQVYARQANFNLSNINPVNPVARSEETGSQDDETHNDQANSGNEVTHNESEEQEEGQIASTVRTGSNAWWVLVVLVSLGLLWWITNRHDQENKA
jgi:hypothetical protein